MKFPLPLVALLALGTFTLAQNSGKPTPRAAKPGPAPAPAAAPADAGAPDPAEPETPEKTVARFFGFLQRNAVEKAYDQLVKGTKIAERPDDVRLLKSKTTDAIREFGVMNGYDQISRKAVGERLICCTYISLGKEFPLRWRFYFYKPQDAWKLIDLRCDDRLAAIFDEPEPRNTRD